MYTSTNVRSKRLAPATAAIVAGLALSSSALADFSFPDFTSTAGLNLVGVATQSGSSISITPPTNAAAGAVWFAAGKQFVGNGFSTTFTFRIRDLVGEGRHGLAFVIQNTSNTALGGEGGGLGYGTYLPDPINGNFGISNSLAVEFDSWDNETANQWQDFSNNSHVSVQSNGTAINTPDESASLSHVNVTDFSDAQIHTVRVNYVPGTLQVFLDNLVTPILTTNVDLASSLNLDANRAWVGLTAATGSIFHVQRHEVLSWDFAGVIPAPGAVTLLGMSGIVALRRRR